VIELLLEFLLQLFGELLVEFGMRTLAEPFRRKPNAIIATIGYAVLGASVGGVSLIFLPAHLVHAADWRFVNLLATPIAVGGCMAAIGTWRASRRQSLIGIEKFFYGYVFALMFALIRFRFAT